MVVQLESHLVLKNWTQLASTYELCSQQEFSYTVLWTQWIRCEWNTWQIIPQFYTGRSHILILWDVFFTYMTGPTVGKKMPGMHHLMKPVLLFSVMAHLGNTQSDSKTHHIVSYTLIPKPHPAFCWLQYSKQYCTWRQAEQGTVRTILLCISIALLCSKRSSAKLLLRAGLI